MIEDLMLAAFFGGWIGWAIAARRQGWSLIIQIGGGLLVGAAFMLIPGAFRSTPDSVPASLEAAGLVGRPWNEAEARLAARITAQALSRMEAELKHADRTGDQALALALMEDLRTNLIEWNDQPENGAAAAYRACHLAAAHAAGCVVDIARGGYCTSAPRFEATLGDCRQLTE